ncbi:glycosyltransferase family protein [Hymenobacter daeguensis]
MADREGLSILIPVFNCDVTKLVWQLVEQAVDWPGPVSIDLLDDGSEREFRLLNAQVADWPLVRYQKLPRNVGRAAVRNQLAANARHEWLLLLDNDGLLPDAQFVRRYAAALGQAPVLIGGTCYRSAPPAEPALYLRWHYGRVREARAAAVRQAAPYSQLTINNALVRAAIFRQFPLDERLTGYGHEDTKFGVELAAARVPVRHLDNPVLHEGLEPAAIFLQKSEQAVHNLAQVYRQDGLGTDSRLLQAVLRLQRLGLAGVAGAMLAAAAPRLRRQLLSAAPRLRALDLLKLHWLLRELA